ncbi:hypothetical protein [Pseudomonas sp. 31 R 17]|nr:hypothetical protein [Pseudomonas sp. 31 R 17]
MVFSLHTVLEGTRGLDTETNLTLEINRATKPQLLSDFAGGFGYIYDGYSLQTSEFTIELDSDPRRLHLKFKDNNTATLNPDFVRAFNPKDPFNQLQVLPLKSGQTLILHRHHNDTPYDYVVTRVN